MPALWHEIESNLHRLLVENDEPFQHSQYYEEGEKLQPLPKQCIPFAPYVEKETHDPHTPADINLDGRGIDINIIRNWITICTKRHGQNCQWEDISSGARGSGPMYLVDVDAMRIIRAGPESSYVALSYVWGENDFVPKLTPVHSSVGTEIDAWELGSGVPLLIVETLELVKNLGKKHLWIDRFCIPQEDGLQKQAQLDLMGSIYNGAWLTIVAAGDSVRSLYRFRKVISDSYVLSGPPPDSIVLKQPNLGYNKLENEMVILRNSRLLMASRWGSRAWTFQEHLFSRRRLIFQNDTIGWECEGSSWHETQDLSSLLQSNDLPPALKHGEIHYLKASPWPNMHRYARLVSLYNRRQLTYPEDAHDAFRGALTIISKSYTGTFLSGLPQMFFDETLLWQPWFPMQRRKARRVAEEDAVLPSWSWLGWSGDLHSESFATAYSYLRPIIGRGISKLMPLPWSTKSSVDWYYSETLGSPRVRIAKEEVCRYGNNLEVHTHGKLHEGFSKDTDIYGNTFYHHQSSESQTFWSPIAIVSQSQLTPSLIKARFIHGRTRIAQLRLGKVVFPEASNCFSVALLSPREEQNIGFLRLNRRKTKGLLKLRSTTCQLVEISSGILRADNDQEPPKVRRWAGDYQGLNFDEWSWLDNRSDYEFYNVLCVGWRTVSGQRVAFRRALGRVDKTAWDAIATLIDVTLG